MNSFHRHSVQLYTSTHSHSHILTITFTHTHTHTQIHTHSHIHTHTHTQIHTHTHTFTHTHTHSHTRTQYAQSEGMLHTRLRVELATYDTRSGGLPSGSATGENLVQRYRQDELQECRGHVIAFVITQS